MSGSWLMVNSEEASRPAMMELFSVTCVCIYDLYSF